MGRQISVDFMVWMRKIRTSTRAYTLGIKRQGKTRNVWMIKLDVFITSAERKEESEIMPSFLTWVLG